MILCSGYTKEEALLLCIVLVWRYNIRGVRAVHITADFFRCAKWMEITFVVRIKVINKAKLGHRGEKVQ